MSVTPEQIKQAQDILALYGQKLEPEYEGYRWYWHAYHATCKCYYQTWAELVKRIITIGTVKPDGERAQRFSLYRPVTGALPQELADASRALANAYRAWADAYRAHVQEIDALWRVECPDAVALWSEERNELVFGGAK